MIHNVFTPFDVVVVAVYLTLVLAILIPYSKRNRDKEPWRKYLIPGLLLKVFGGLFIAFIYEFYYGGGDTTGYFITSRGISRMLVDDPDMAYRVIFNSSIHERWLIDYYRFIAYKYQIIYFRDDSALTVSILGLPLFWLSFGTMYGTTFLISLFSFLGVWVLYKHLCKKFPGMELWFALSIFFIPSLFSWGSAFLKDSFTLSFLCFFFILVSYLFNDFVHFFQRLLFSAFLIFLCVIGLLAIKPYIILSFLPFALLLNYRRLMKNEIEPRLRFIISPVVGAVMIFGLAYSLEALGNATDRYKLDETAKTAAIVSQDLSRDYYYKESEGSRYEIGEFEPTLAGMLSKFPMATFTALFRPLPWEAHNLPALLASVENILIIWIFIITLVKVGFFNFWVILIRNPYATSFFFFAISFGFMVGLTSGNFGNLSRYRIPLIPFFISSLFIIQYEYYKRKAAHAAFQPPFRA